MPRDGTTGGDLDAIYAKVARRIIPFVVVLFVVAWLDRVNVGFAKLQMVADLGFSEAVYGFGAGIFYVGYLIFEVPSNLLLHRIGARKTLARITILWGLTSIATMFVRTAGEFYLVRFLLGAFEAGLYPGVILYLTYWFPERRRAHMVGLFMTAIPIAGIVGGPLSGWIMSATGDRGGLANWQWLFVLEGIPSLVCGALTFFLVVDQPRGARWLTTHEQQLLAADLEADQRHATRPVHAFVDALRAPRVWLLAVVYFCLVSANPTLGFWAPTLIKALGVTSNTTIGLLSSIPYIVGMMAIIVVGKHSDRTLERRRHAALACAVAAGGLVVIGAASRSPVLGFVALTASTAGVLSAFAPFWQIPTTMLSGAAAAGGIALVNSLGNLSGWLGPFIVGWLVDVTGNTAAGLYVVAGLEALAAAMIISLIPHRTPET